MIRTFMQKASTSGTPGTGIQATASLVLGHNYEQNTNDITGNFPLGWAIGTPAYANAWSAQGYGLTNFGSGGLTYFVNAAINSTFETGTFTVAWHFRTGSVVNGDYYIIGDGSTFNGVMMRLNTGTTLQYYEAGGSGVSYGYSLATNTNYHLAITRSAGSFLYMYLNGTNVATGSQSTVNTGGTQYKIGTNFPSSWAIYDYGVWNISMNSTQINNIMNNLVP